MSMHFERIEHWSVINSIKGGEKYHRKGHADPILYTGAMQKDEKTQILRADFDRLALFSREEWDHNSHYHHFLLRHIPPHCTNALEIGCGTGSFARLLASQAKHVLALDLSPEMIRIARERSKDYTSIDFQVADALSWEFPTEQFDCIASIATLHHLPMEEMLSRMKAALNVNGTLLVLDLFQGRLPDMPASMVAFPVNIALKYMKTGRVRTSREAQAAWAEHGQRDSYLAISQVRHLCADLLPGAKVRKHLLWRYSIVWKKAALTQGEGIMARAIYKSHSLL